MESYDNLQFKLVCGLWLIVRVQGGCVSKSIDDVQEAYIHRARLLGGPTAGQ